MLYVLGTKNFEVYNGKNLNICRVPAKCTRKTNFAECLQKTLGGEDSGLPSA